jgi:D-glycero-D-manno-heptose 1,7-bisphosphate phosphatase
MKNLIIFDKDQTLVEPLSGEKYVQHPRDQKILESIDGQRTSLLIRDLSNCGYEICVASNQGGVGRYKTLEEAKEEFTYLLVLFPEIAGAVFAPGKGYECYEVARRPEDLLIKSKKIEEPGLYRKPDPDMIGYLAAFYGDGECHAFIGDRPEDEQAAEAAGIPFLHRDTWLSRGNEAIVA